MYKQEIFKNAVCTFRNDLKMKAQTIEGSFFAFSSILSLCLVFNLMYIYFDIDIKQFIDVYIISEHFIMHFLVIRESKMLQPSIGPSRHQTPTNKLQLDRGPEVSEPRQTLARCLLRPLSNHDTICRRGLAAYQSGDLR